jgi:tetratricopeptide (TPR) repeat protein
LAEVSYNHDWDWPRAEREFHRAIALNPNYATAHHWYAGYLSSMGQDDEALAEIRKAQELDPRSVIISIDIGFTFYAAGKYDLAIKELQSRQELDPDSWFLKWWLGKSYLANGRYKEGLRELQSAVDLSEGNPSTLAQLAYGYAISGKQDKARQILSILERKSKKVYVSPFQFALVYAGLGKKDQAIYFLEKAFQEHYLEMRNLKVDQVWHPLHSDPRFQDLVRRMNFPKISE